MDVLYGLLTLGLTLLLAASTGRGQQECDAGCAPTWEIPEPSVKREYRLAGETANFRCRAFGNPRPLVKWIVNDKHLNPYDQSDERVTMTTDGLSIRDLRPQDSGVYVCVVQNRFGTIQWAIDLTVYGEDRQRPLGQYGRPDNLTARVGETVVFKCALTSDDDRATITWVKHMTSQEEHHVLKSSSFWDFDSLQLEEVSLNDTGLYRCIINVSSQVTQFSGWLTVLPNEDPRVAGSQQNGGSTPAFITYLQGVGISVGAILALFLVGALLISAVSYYRSRNQPPPPPALLTQVRPVDL